MELLLKLWGIAPQLLEGLSYIVTGATALAVLTPTTKDDTFWSKVRGFIDLLAGNVGNNK